MISSMVLAVVVGALSGLVTIVVAAMLVRRALERRLAAAGDEISAKVRAAVEEGAEAVVPKIRDAVRSGLDDSVHASLPTVRQEVAAGVGDGSEKVIPEIRAEVRRGVEEAITSAVTGGVVGKAGEELARKGTSVLNRILGGPEER